LYEDVWDPCDLEALDKIKERYVPMFTMMDKDCNPIGCSNLYTTFGGEKECLSLDAVDPALICGDLDVNWITSPVSLIWEADVKVEQVSSIVRFALDPDKDKSWVIWRASEKTPLIVYDPEHAGKITTGKQLFGEWTLGGKGTSTGDDAVKRQPYEHGYEALASLDKDNNGRLEGKELKDLGLWFDRNQDGLSQPGEVVPITSAGVTVLYVEPDEINKAGGFVKATVGYEKVEKGKIIKGASIDWYSPVFASKEEALADWQARKALSTARPFAASGEKAVSKVSTDQIPGGVWVWALTEDTDKGSGNMGVLSIFEDGENLIGYSIVETMIRAKADNSERSYTISYPIIGKKLKDSSGRTTYNFAIINGDRLTKNRAVLSEDGTVLQGQSVVQSRQESVELDYKWRARRAIKVHAARN
jgi:hypothetical protein